MQTQLLCTFCEMHELDDTLQSIMAQYNIAFDVIYVLQNVDEPTRVCCTYNVVTSGTSAVITPKTTISLHRKKATNTLYTINALNILVASLNNGKIDKNFKLPWHEYANCILVTVHDELKQIHTKLHKIVRLTR